LPLAPLSIFARTSSLAAPKVSVRHWARIIAGEVSATPLPSASRALCRNVIMRLGPSGRISPIPYRAHHRSASPVRNSPWLSNRIVWGLSSSMSIRIVRLLPNGPCTISSAPCRTRNAAYAPRMRTCKGGLPAFDLRYPPCYALRRQAAGLMYQHRYQLFFRCRRRHQTQGCQL
jgi:hypothetical protein